MEDRSVGVVGTVPSPPSAALRTGVQRFSVLKAEQIKKVFIKARKEISVIRGIDLTIESGEMVAITGASGAGKSTLLHILGTLEAPTTGRVLFGQQQQDLFKYSER